MREASMPSSTGRARRIYDLRARGLDLEVANAVLVGERKKRLKPAEVEIFTSLLESLPVVQDRHPVSDNIRSVLAIARVHGLSAYDAVYLELSIRQSAPLATFDRKLQKAANEAGIKLFKA